MAENSIRSMFVVNPASANGRTCKTWIQLEKHLKDNNITFGVSMTSRPLEAIELTRKALWEGYEHIIAVGGDGTLNEVVNGFFDDQGVFINESARLSMIPMGTGGDFARLMQMSNQPENIVRLFLKPQTVSCDLVRATFTNWQGEPASRYFINIADVGLGSDTVFRVNRNSKLMGGPLSFLVGAVTSIIAFKNLYLKVNIDNRNVYAGDSCLAAIGNGQYFGGGMKVTPRAVINDGWLDIVVVEGLGKLELMRNIIPIRKGEHLKNPRVHYHTGKKVIIESQDNLYFEMDGETPGRGNLIFEVLPAAMNLIV
ncbi:MAG: diacylglycerol kinase family lipid kinase [Syntrophomonadaceae bacterium]|nr:diacylglycerol kinase family lipid kinase [Syntrophomonadaceae bacterium]